MKGKLSACRHCNETGGVRKHGKARSGIQRYYCCECRKSFQIKYIYHVYKNRHEEIIPGSVSLAPFTTSDVC